MLCIRRAHIGLFPEDQQGCDTYPQVSVLYQDPWGRVESVNSEGVSREEKLWGCYG